MFTCDNVSPHTRKKKQKHIYFEYKAGKPIRLMEFRPNLTCKQDF